MGHQNQSRQNQPRSLSLAIQITPRSPRNSQGVGMLPVHDALFESHHPDYFDAEPTSKQSNAPPPGENCTLNQTKESFKQNLAEMIFRVVAYEQLKAAKDLSN